ncbi:MAG TPA: T9SS type A sorting domain-containing protein, partial [Candidatus Kryptobacter bacterium]|nr:T9SS type A sorting domain-containing protein [Candidatus Kryptobacter bacterium]
NTSDFDNQMSLCSNYIPQGFQLSPGIDMSSAGSVANTIYEIQDAVRRNVAGVTIWYYGYLSTYPDAFADLKSQVFPDMTLPSYDDLVMDNSSGIFSSTGAWTTERGGYNGNYLSAQAVQGDTAIFSVRILRSGSYTLYGYWGGDSSSNCSNAIVGTSTSAFVKSDTVNQKVNLNTWSYIDKFQLNSGDTVTIRLAGTGGGNLVADAFRLRRANPFVLSDYAVPDSQTVLMKFSNPLLNPISPITSVSTSLTGTNVNLFVDPVDKTILHVIVPSLQENVPFTVDVKNLLDIAYDTLTVSQTLAYDPDSTMFVIDDETPNSFSKQSGSWFEDTSQTAINGEYWLAKQGGQVARVQWGPLTIKTDGYYDVYAHIPRVQVPLTTRCVYIVMDHFGTDSVYVSQATAAGSGSWTDLGNFPYRAGDTFATLLSSIAGSDTARYVAADAIMIVRAVQVTGVKAGPNVPHEFAIFQNYPNPFNPSTVISFRLKSKAAVYVTVYNVLGQRVSELVNGRTYAVGTWSVKFNGSSLPSGLYFASVRIKATSFDGRKVLKMLLLK